ncbi:hypothetical protein BOX15_Mlig022923g2, partial [Macrostomum lignano]
TRRRHFGAAGFLLLSSSSSLAPKSALLAGASRSLASSSASASGGGGGPKPREPARVRSDNAPLYEQIRRERRGITERVALDKRRVDLRRRQIGASAEADAATPSTASTKQQQQLRAARAKPVQLPPNCLPWRDYALFADPPRLQPLKSLDSAEDGGSFASLLRRSSFVGLGNFENRIVAGRVFERYEGSLYVDFGGKFHAVCPAPRVNNEKYVRGAQVLLRLIDPEMTSRFLGSERHVTLGEADAVLLGLRPAEPGHVAELIADSGYSPDSQLADGGAEADTVSPLRLSVLQPALLEEAAAEAAAVDQPGPMDDWTGPV